MFSQTPVNYQTPRIPRKRYQLRLDSIQGGIKLGVFEVTRDIDGNITNEAEKKTILLQETTPEEILQMKKNLQPVLVVKVEDKLFFAEIKERLSFSSVEVPHLCSRCRNCSPLSCPKIFDPFNMELLGSDSYRSLIKKSKRIERYDFVRLGIETYNVRNPCLIIGKCELFK